MRRARAAFAWRLRRATFVLSDWRRCSSCLGAICRWLFPTAELQSRQLRGGERASHGFTPEHDPYLQLDAPALTGSCSMSRRVCVQIEQAAIRANGQREGLDMRQAMIAVSMADSREPRECDGCFNAASAMAATVPECPCL